MYRAAIALFGFLVAIGPAHACNLDAENERVSQLFGSLALDEQTEKALAQEMMAIAMEIHAAANAGDQRAACEIIDELLAYLDTYPKK